MAFQRASRAGDLARIPLMCDPDLRALVVSTLTGAGDEADALTERLRLAVALYHETLDPMGVWDVLGGQPVGVAYATIRGLTGGEFADARRAALLAAGTDSQAHIEAELIRRGLVALDGFDERPVDGMYPVEALYGPGGLGRDWAMVRAELAARIDGWSHLGKQAGSSCARSSGEPMLSDAAHTSTTATLSVAAS